MKITTIDIDLAKEASAKRKEVIDFFTLQKPCLIGMETCGGAHFWARHLTNPGYMVKRMAPQFVKLYVKANKHDAVGMPRRSAKLSRDL
jgi:transposase